MKLFLRFEYLTFAVVLPLLGASAVGVTLSGWAMVRLIAVAISFHVYVSLLNDLADLPLDRLNPHRADYPLVRGTILPSQALAVVLMQLPIAAALTAWLGGSAGAYLALALALGMMTVYNLFGKRLPFPPAIDIVQGVGFAAMALYGAAITGRPTRSTLIVFLLVVVWMVLTNLFGGLRDLNTDVRCGVKSTPIFLGARPRENGHSIPGLVAAYAYTAQVILIAVEMLALVYNDFAYTFATQVALGIVVSVAGLIALFLLATLLRAAADDREAMLAAMVLQLFSSSLPVLALFSAKADLRLGLLISLVFLASFRDFDPQPMIRYWQRRSPRSPCPNSRSLT